MKSLNILFSLLFFINFTQASATINVADAEICCYTEEGLLVKDVTYETNPPSNIVVDDCFDLTTVEYPITVTPSKDNDHINGVSTLDLVLMTYHILGLQILDSPYKMIAADVNNDGKITTSDIIGARFLILNMTPSFTNNTSWRFIPADYEFSNPQNPWGGEIPEYNYMLDIPVTEFDYIAIKVGDVNGTAIPE